MNGETNRTEISSSFSMFDLKWARPVKHAPLSAIASTMSQFLCMIKK